MTRQVAQKKRRSTVWRNLRHDWPIHIGLLLGLALSFLPLVLMVLLSFKSPSQFLTQPLTLTFPLHFENYVIAFNVTWRSLLNTVGLAFVNVFCVLAFATMAAYAFTRMRFPGRGVLYWLVLALLFVPSLLTFAPRFVVVSQLHLTNSYAALTLPYIAGSMVFEIFVLMAFFRSIAREVLEAAMLDGAGPLTILTRIVIPLARPILATLAVLRTLDFWNDWLWPLVTITDRNLRPVALQVLFLTNDLGADMGRQMAGFVIASIPLFVLFLLMSRQFVSGLSSGSVKL
jgi:ABC-type glycerol-3-phosphate transport system permease component